MPTLVASSIPRPEEIATERARRHLGVFIRAAWPVVEPATPFVAGWHIDCIADHLEAVSAGEIRDLLITVPPRCMKSLSVSVFWPVWSWATDPALRFLFNSYAESLSIGHSLKCRRIIESPWHRARWGHVYQLTGDQNAKMRFENDKTGYRIAASVGGANTGEGGDILVVDDAHSIEEAESEPMRERALTWWNETMSTRLNDQRTGRRVIVGQRIHEADLPGHVLAQGTWHHLNLPMEYERRVVVEGFTSPSTVAARPEHAEAQPHDDCPISSDPRTEDGALLWPEKVGPPELAKLKRDLGPYGVAGQLQQRPVPRAGAVFRSDWFRPLPPDFDVPGAGGATRRSLLLRAMFVDLAFSAKDSADYTAAVTVGIDPEQNLYVLDVLRKRVDEARLDVTLADHIGLVRPHVVGIEDGAFKQYATGDLIRMVYQHLQAVYPVRISAIRVTADKFTRAQLPAGRAAAGMVYADRRAPWWADFETELLRFPKGIHDDQVDALSGATQLALESQRLTQRPRRVVMGD